MTMEEHRQMMEDTERQHTAAVEQLKSECSDGTYQHHPKVDYSISPYWFNVDIYRADGRIIPNLFSCPTLDALKSALHRILDNGLFYDATAFVENCSYVTFYSARTLDAKFDYYYHP